MPAPARAAKAVLRAFRHRAAGQGWYWRHPSDSRVARTPRRAEYAETHRQSDYPGPVRSAHETNPLARPGVGDQLRPERPRVAQVAPAPLRVGLIDIVAGLLAAAVGGADGFWLCLPAGLLAAAVAQPPVGGLVVCGAGVAGGAAAAAAVQRGVLPPFWLVLFVPAACMVVLLAPVAGCGASATRCSTQP